MIDKIEVLRKKLSVFPSRGNGETGAVNQRLHRTGSTGGYGA